MASTDMASQFKETVKTLDLDNVPDKLKCAICSKLALNAFKLPCCGQSTCDSCQQSLPTSCPVCEHSPVTSDMCTPHKALRNTLKAYLKTAEKRLAEERLKSQPPVPTISTPGEANASEAPEPFSTQDQASSIADARTSTNNASAAIPDAQSQQTYKRENEAQRSSALVDFVASRSTEPSPSIAQNTKSGVVGQEIDEKRLQSETAAVNGDVQRAQDSASDQSKTPSNVMSSNFAQSNSFANMQNMNMGFGNMDYNQMLQNSMPGGMNYGIVGMSGMNFMDPMAQMSQMYGGFGGPNMSGGMNGIDMNFNANQGPFGGWNGQNNMWQGTQSMNNQNAFAQGMGGDFGSNSGYGYNFSHQGNFSQQQYQNNDFQSGYHGRGHGHFGRGRGRGYGRGRGNFNNFQHGTGHSHQQPYHAANQQRNLPATEAQAPSESKNGELHIEETASSSGEKMQTLDEEFAPGGLDDVKEVFASDAAELPTSKLVPDENLNNGSTEPEGIERRPEVTSKESKDTEGRSETGPVDSVLVTQTSPEGSTVPRSDPVVDTSMTDDPVAMPPPSAPLGPAAQFHDSSKDVGFRGRGRGSFLGRGRGYVNGNVHTTARPDAPPNAPTEPKGQGVVGAPTGPKSMRTGFPGPPRGKGLGIQVVGRASMAGRDTQSQDPQSARSEFSSRSRERVRSRSRSHTRSPSRSASPHRSRRHRHRESDYRSESDDDQERRRERRHRRSKHDGYEDEHMTVNGNGYQSSSSTLEHSSRRRDRQKSDRSSRPHKSSHKSHRHRSRSRDYDRHRDEDNEIAFDPQPGLDRDILASNMDSDNRVNGHRHHKHRSHQRDHSHEGHRDRKRSRRHYEDDGQGEYEVDKNEDSHRSRRQKREEEIKIPTGPRSMVAQKPMESEKDPHALEREARNRERMEKERQRRDATNAEESRRRDSRHERVSGGRRVSYKFEGSPSRIEQEREAARWR